MFYRHRPTPLRFEELEPRQLLATGQFVSSPITAAFEGEAAETGTVSHAPSSAAAVVTRSVDEFGAVGDGVADDTSAIQQAIDAVAGAGGGTVAFPVGTYLVSISAADRLLPAIAVRANVTLQGAGADRSVIKLADNQGNYDALLGASPASDDLSNFALLDLGIDGNGPNNPVSGEGDLQGVGLLRYGLRVFSGVNVAIEGNRFFNQTNVNVITLNGPTVSDAVIRNNTFDLVGGGSADYDHSTIYTDGRRITIAGNTFTSRNGPGTSGARTAIEIHGSDQRVTGNTISGYFTGVNVTGVADVSDNQLYAENILRDVAIGFMVWATNPSGPSSTPALTNVVIRDNDIGIELAGWRGFFDGSDRSGITFEPNRNATIRNLDILHNHIWYASFTGELDFADQISSGISLWSFEHPDVRVEYLRILNNRVEDSPGPGIHLDGVLDQTEVAGNVIVNPGRSENDIDAVYRSGIYLGNRVGGAQVNDNRLIDDQPASTMQFGIVERTESQGGNSAARNTVDVSSGAIVETWSANPDQPGVPWNLDPSPTVGFAAASSNSGPFGGTVIIPVELSGRTGQRVTVTYSVLGGTAVCPDDFMVLAGELTFEPGMTSRNISLNLAAGAAAGKTVVVRLAWPVNASSGATAQHTVTIADMDAVSMGNQKIVESDGDIVSISLRGPGTLGVSLGEPDAGGQRQININLAGTTADQSTLTIKVRRKSGGDGLANVGEITADGGLKRLAGTKVNLTGAGLNVSGAARYISLHDLLNGADVTLGGTPKDSVKLTLHHVEDGTNMNIAGGIASLTAAHIGAGNIFAPSLRMLRVKGDRKAGLTGDLRASVFLSGEGLAPNKNALNSLIVSHAIVDAVFAVYGSSGGIGRVTAGRMIHSGIYAGYVPDDFDRPLDGGTFTAEMSVKSIHIKGIKNEGPAFSNSFLAASKVGTVSLASVDLSTDGEFAEDYGILADQAIGKVAAKAPKFKFNPRGPADQTTETPSRFHVKTV